MNIYIYINAQTYINKDYIFGYWRESEIGESLI